MTCTPTVLVFVSLCSSFTFYQQLRSYGDGPGFKMTSERLVEKGNPWPLVYKANDLSTTPRPILQGYSIPTLNVQAVNNLLYMVYKSLLANS